MSIQLVITVLRALCDKYAQTQEQQEKIYKARGFLDKAFSGEKDFSNEKLIEKIENIDAAFFKATAIKDEAKNIKAYILVVVKKLLGGFK